MNTVLLRGVLKNIEYSHTIGAVEFDKAQLLVPRRNGAEDVIDLKFKAYSNKHKDNDEVALRGNLRSYSHKVGDKNKVDIYVFTYFDDVEDVETTEDGLLNKVEITGRICKMNPLRVTQNKRHNVHFIIANNLQLKDSTKRLNSYIPCIAWGSIAREISELPVNTKLQLEGELHSREHKKLHENGDVEIRVAHELTITSYKIEE